MLGLQVGNTFAHGDAEGKHLPPKQAKPHAPVALAVDDDSHLGQKRFLPEDDNKVGRTSLCWELEERSARVWCTHIC